VRKNRGFEAATVRTSASLELLARCFVAGFNARAAFLADFFGTSWTQSKLFTAVTMNPIVLVAYAPGSAWYP